MWNDKNEGEVIPIALYSEKIAENDRKIEQLSKNIKRDTEKRKKLMEYRRIPLFFAASASLLKYAPGPAKDRV